MKFSILYLDFLVNLYAGHRPAFETNYLVC